MIERCNDTEYRYICEKCFSVMSDGICLIIAVGYPRYLCKECALKLSKDIADIWNEKASDTPITCLDCGKELEVKNGIIADSWIRYNCDIGKQVGYVCGDCSIYEKRRKENQ